MEQAAYLKLCIATILFPVKVIEGLRQNLLNCVPSVSAGILRNKNPLWHS